MLRATPRNTAAQERLPLYRGHIPQECFKRTDNFEFPAGREKELKDSVEYVFKEIRRSC